MARKDIYFRLYDVYHFQIAFRHRPNSEMDFIEFIEIVMVDINIKLTLTTKADSQTPLHLKPLSYTKSSQQSYTNTKECLVETRSSNAREVNIGTGGLETSVSYSLAFPPHHPNHWEKTYRVAILRTARNCTLACGASFDRINCCPLH